MPLLKNRTPILPPDEKPVDEAKKSKDLFIYSKSGDRFQWATETADDLAFYNGAIFTTDDADAVRATGAPVPSIQVLKAGISQLVAQLTANKPRFSAIARENSDVSLAGTYADLFSYVWDVSSGNRELKVAVTDYEKTGIGVLMAYFDPNADNGKGEILITSIDPRDIYVDPNARRGDCADAGYIMTVQQFSKNQLSDMYPDFDFSGAEATREDNHVQHDRSEENHQTTDPYRFGETAEKDNPIYDVIDRYSKKRIMHFHIFDPFTDFEKILKPEEFLEYRERIAVVTVKNDREPEYTTDQREVTGLLKIIEATGGVYMISPETGSPTAPEYNENGQPLGVIVKMQAVRVGDLIDNKVIKVKTPLLTRIHRVLTIGHKIHYDGLMEISEYPIVTMMLHHNRSPFAYGDVRMVKSLVEQLNKIESLIITHAINTTNMKVFIPEGVGDKKDFENRWNMSGSQLFFYNAEDLSGSAERIKFAVPPPLPNEVYALRNNYINEIERELGAFAFQDGDVSQAPPTARGTLLLDEMGQRRSRSKREDIEEAVNQLAKAIAQMIPLYYTERKIIRLVTPNHETREVTLNERNGAEILNDVTNWNYDIKVISGSMLPSNRWARQDYYLELYKLGILQDKSFIIRESEIPNVEVVLEREDTITQLKGMLGQYEQKIKQLEGDMQTADRELKTADRQVSKAKFDGQLKGIQSKLESKVETAAMRLTDQVKESKNTEPRERQ